MMEISLYERKTLYDRHRLSHQQIDELLGEQQRNLVFDEKKTQLILIPEFLKIAGFLRRAGIWFISLKGPLLSYRIYGDATRRRFKDFDILIRRAAINQTIEILRPLGYYPISFEWPETENQQNIILSTNNQFVLYNPIIGTMVEVHWNLFNYPVIGFEQMTAVVNRNIRQISFTGQQFYQFSPEFELLYLVIHGGIHAWARLKWLIDIHEIVNRCVIDKNTFDDLVNQLNSHRMVGLCNAMLCHFFPGTQLPVNYRFSDWGCRFALQQASGNKDVIVNPWANFFTFVRFRMLAFPGWKNKLRVLYLIPYWLQPLLKNAPLYIVFSNIFKITRNFMNRINLIKELSRNGKK